MRTSSFGGCGEMCTLDGSVTIVLQSVFTPSPDLAAIQQWSSSAAAHIARTRLLSARDVTG